MSLAERRWLRLFTLCTLYVAQGIPWGFTAVTIPAYLGERGLDTAAIGSALAMTTLPYSFKWVWGPIIDAYTLPRFGRRRPWIVFAQGMMALTILSMILIPDLTVDLKMLAWIVLVHTVFNSLQDVAVDALAVDLLEEHERGRANGLMYASKYGGGIIGGSVMATIVAASNLETALIVQTAILVAIMMVPLLVRETPKPLEERPRLGDVLRGLVEVFSVRSVLITALLMLSVNFALGVVTANGFVLFTQNLKWTPEEYARLTGGLGLAAGFGGAVLGGWLADVVGRRKLAAIASISLAVVWIVFGSLTQYWDSDAFIYATAMLQTLATSIMTVTLFALCMDVSWARIGASQFTAYMALANFSTTAGFRFSSTLTSWLDSDYARCYLVVAAIQIGVTAWLLFIDPKQTARELPRPEGASLPVSGIVAVSGLGVVLAALTYYVISPML
ncbi:MAG: MFS transporter [Deltaproteobacteria bacterium]|nr:MFS transporter [Deltaproteobacteria bacterium]